MRQSITKLVADIVEKDQEFIERVIFAYEQVQIISLFIDNELDTVFGRIEMKKGKFVITKQNKDVLFSHRERITKEEILSKLLDRFKP